MKLETKSGELFHLHTQHEIETIGDAKHRVTQMILHRGSCTAEHPCGTPATRARAVCHERDQYVRVVGNKLAFTRVLKGFPKPMRRELWNAFWQKHSKPRG